MGDAAGLGRFDDPFAKYLTSQAAPVVRAQPPLQRIGLAGEEQMDTRRPALRVSDVYSADLARDSTAMRSMDVDVAEWAVVKDVGRWIRFKVPGVQVAMEIQLTGLFAASPVKLSLQKVPKVNCTACVPVEEDPSKLVVAFARRQEYEHEVARRTAAGLPSVRDTCATVVPALVQTAALAGSTLAVRQQPATRACAVDLFVWVPGSLTQRAATTLPSRGMLAGTREFSSTRLPCGGDVGALPGSSSIDGFRGTVQRSLSCVRNDYTTWQVDDTASIDGSTELPSCPTRCARGAISREVVMSRSLHDGESSGLENAYDDVLAQLASHREQSAAAARSTAATSAAALEFEASLSHGVRMACCAGFTCSEDETCVVARDDSNTSFPPPPLTPLSQSAPPPSPSPSPPPATPSPWWDSVNASASTDTGSLEADVLVFSVSFDPTEVNADEVCDVVKPNVQAALGVSAVECVVEGSHSAAGVNGNGGRRLQRRTSTDTDIVAVVTVPDYPKDTPSGVAFFASLRSDSAASVVSFLRQHVHPASLGIVEAAKFVETQEAVEKGEEDLGGLIAGVVVSVVAAVGGIGALLAYFLLNKKATEDDQKQKLVVVEPLDGRVNYASFRVSASSGSKEPLLLPVRAASLQEKNAHKISDIFRNAV